LIRIRTISNEQMLFAISPSIISGESILTLIWYVDVRVQID
jgi:hypothetical protein